jgi:tetratricopeptide (TPR) repeat protein
VLAADGTLIGLTLPDTGHPDGVRVAPASLLVPLVRRPGQLRSWASGGGQPLAEGQADALEKALAAVQEGRHADALEQIRRLRVSQADSAWYWHAEGALQEALGKGADAVTSYRAAVRLRPQDGPLAASLGDVLAGLGRHEEAIKAYRQAIAANDKLVRAHTKLGDSLHILARLDEAIETYRGALVLDSRNAEAYLGLGVAYHDSGAISRALTCWKRAMKYGSGTPVAEEAGRRLRAAAGATQEPEPGPQPRADGDDTQ